MFTKDAKYVSRKCAYRYFFEVNEDHLKSPGQAEYMLSSSIEFYSNYLDWFYKTFHITESVLRTVLFKHYKPFSGHSILITGAGLGHELDSVLNIIHTQKLRDCTVVAQDISSVFIDYIFQHLADAVLQSHQSLGTTIVLFNGDAGELPLTNDHFDYIHHFGGINRFPDVERAISEMSRCLAPETGVAMFSDESVAPWLRSSDYGKMIILNNSLYKAIPPLSLLPRDAIQVTLEFIVKNCFYMISFSKSNDSITINPHIPHKSPRGGTMYKRFYGQLDGVSPEILSKLKQLSTSLDTPLNSLLEDALLAHIDRLVAHEN